MVMLEFALTFYFPFFNPKQFIRKSKVSYSFLVSSRPCCMLFSLLAFELMHFFECGRGRSPGWRVLMHIVLHMCLDSIGPKS